MKNKTLKVMSVKLDMPTRKLVAKLQKERKATFSELVRTGLRLVADQPVSAQ